jgi:hypothetical protein
MPFGRHCGPIYIHILLSVSSSVLPLVRSVDVHKPFYSAKAIQVHRRFFAYEKKAKFSCA